MGGAGWAILQSRQRADPGRYVSPMPVPLLRQLVGQSQEQLMSRLAEARTRFEHRGDRGTAGGEAPFRDFLSAYLPRGLSVGQGEVIDTHDGRSGQVDVVIADSDHRLRSRRPNLVCF